jgi:hypothetical protein
MVVSILLMVLMFYLRHDVPLDEQTFLMVMAVLRPADAP